MLALPARTRALTKTRGRPEPQGPMRNVERWLLGIMSAALILFAIALEVWQRQAPAFAMPTPPPGWTMTLPPTP